MDAKAKKILFNTFWKNGWIDKPFTKPEDFEYAKSKGLMFDPITIDHDECIRQILSCVEQITPQLVGKAFLMSLSSKRLDLRSGIASYYIAKQLSLHNYSPVVSGHSYKDGKIVHTSHTCGTCRDAKYGIVGYKSYNNDDLNVLNFERIKWGGVRHGDLLYTLLDLHLFLKEEIQNPLIDDIETFKKILQTIESSAVEDYPSTLEKRLKEILKSSKNERKILIEILACIGVLKPKSYDRPIKGKSDWVYVQYWRGEDKYNQIAVNDFFGKYIH